ncbi:hypothetical protein LIER_21312 [Lithospermum erythrorhizon]|uniref:PB1 domain-containing protein n=1 Tax=Lithospermum erythrorhizon TaxID=34254 RepID=A0AAV3QRA6_LITER
MGKARAKRMKNLGGKSKDSLKHSKGNDNSPRKYDKDTAVFISMSQELKDEGNKLFQRRDYEGAILKYQKAIKLLPGNHIDVSYLRSNLAACYMQMGLTEYPRAIHECNLALEVTPKYSKALLKRSRCYEALNRLDFALRDVNTVLNMEPNNIMATEIAERVKTAIDQRGTGLDDIPIEVVPVTEHVEPSLSQPNMQKTEGNKHYEIFDGKEPDNILEERMTGDCDESNNSDSSQKKPEDRIEVKKSEDIMMEGSIGGYEPDSIAEDDITLKGDGKRVGYETEKMATHRTEDNLSDAIETEVSTFENKLRSIFERKITQASDGTQTINNFGKKIKDELLRKSELLEIGLGENKFEVSVDLKIPGNLNKVEMILDTDGKQTNGEHWLEDNMPQQNKVEDLIEDKKAEDKLVVEEKIANTTDSGPRRTLKLVYGEDIRWAQVPLNCSILKLREIIQDRYPNSRAVLVKYRDQEGDLVTITSTEELRWAEASTEHNSVRLYIFEVNPDQDPFFYMLKKDEKVLQFDANHCNVLSNGSAGRSKELPNKPCCIEDWVVQFAHLFKDYVGFDSDAYLDLHEVGMKVYSEAMEEIVTSEEAEGLFYFATERFQEMAALALFNCGNVHMSRARKRVYFTEDHSEESVLEQVRSAYVWAQDEYSKAGIRYKEALKIKTDFYEAVLALGQQQFEQAKLSWYYAISTNVDLESWPSLEVLQLYNNAEENMERGMQMWHEAEEQRLTELSHPSKSKAILQKMKLEDFLKDLSADEAAQQAATMRSQINILWGTLLYERSLMEFKLDLPVWHECLEFAVEKFELAGASPTDIAVMLKNHYSNNTATKGLGFNIDEIVQAWNEMYEAKRWQNGIPSFRLEPLLRRRVSKIYYALEHR